jgi:opacity protein-like surface antigen
VKFLTSVCVFFILAPASWAATGDPYVGLDLDIDQVVWRDSAIAATYPTSNSGGTFRIGDRILDNLAVELGYTNSYGSTIVPSSTGVDNKLSNRLALRELQLDGLAYMPLGKGWFQPFVTAGLAYDEASARLRTITSTYDSTTKLNVNTITSTPYFDKSEIDWRVGFGMEFVPMDGLSARFTVRYAPYSFGGHMAGGVTFGLGLNIGI